MHTSDREPWLRGYLGNGLLAAQLVAEGGLAGDAGTPLHLMAGLFDRAEGEEVERPVPLPAWNMLRLSMAGEALHPSLAHDYEQTLDVRRGLAETTHDWAVDGGFVRVQTTQAVLRHKPHLALIVLSLEAGRACEVEVQADLDATGPHLRRAARGCAEPGQIWAEARTVERDVGLAAAGVLFQDGQSGRVTPGHAAIRVALEPGSPKVVIWLVSIHTDRTAARPREAALAELSRARSLGPAR
ncbi:MAG TPA: hypothetical protein VIG30_04135, partial [Ktedonobacterales bacterium]